MTPHRFEGVKGVTPQAYREAVTPLNSLNSSTDLVHQDGVDQRSTGTKLDSMKTTSISDQLRQFVRTADRSQRQIALSADIDPALLCRFLKGTSQLSSGSLDRLAAQLGLKLVPIEPEDTQTTIKAATKRRKE